MRIIEFVKQVVRMIFIIPIIIYRKVISPMIPNRCIYSPSCSAYTIDAIHKHGVIKGILLGFFRIGRCHSMFNGGDDPVPDEVSWRQIRTDYRTFRDR